MDNVVDIVVYIVFALVLLLAIRFIWRTLRGKGPEGGWHCGCGTCKTGGHDHAQTHVNDAGPGDASSARTLPETCACGAPDCHAGGTCACGACTSA